MSDVALRTEGLSKRYRIGKLVRYKTLRDTIADAVAAPFRTVASRLNNRPSVNAEGRSQSFIWALKDVSLDIKRGEVIGIIGRNGAGKTTLLKILSRITEPTQGYADIYGRVGSLLEVGTGFHPELTGRENIYLNGAILGMTRGEIQRKFDEIVAFAEIERFLDTPVKQYSNGMYVRLAFAVAAHLEPEILLVDEVLAVGDAEFQRKCLGKMEDVAGEGRTVLFVSHNMGAVLRLVDQCVLLDRGRVVETGAARRVVDAYLKRSFSQAGKIHYPEDEGKIAQVLSVAMKGPQDRITSVFSPSEEILVEVIFLIRNLGHGKIDLLVVFSLTDGTILCSVNTKDICAESETWEAGRYLLQVTFPGNVLNCGRYLVKAVIAIDGKAYHNHPYSGDGLSLEITDASDAGALGYEMRKRDDLLILKPRHRLTRLSS